MKTLLLASANDFLSSYGLIILLAVLLIGTIFISYNRKKNDEQKRQKLNNEIKPGTKVLTYHGVYGEVISLTNTTDGVQVVIKTGDEKHFSYEKIHINAICGIDQSTIVVLDADGNPIVEQTTEEVAPVEETTTSTIEEAVQPAKKTTKKSATKKAE